MSENVSNIDISGSRGYRAAVLPDDPAPQSAPPVRPPDPAHAVDQMLRRALRVGPADASDKADASDSDTWSAAPRPVSDFWAGGPRGRWRPRSRLRAWRARVARPAPTGRARKVTAMVLVGGLAVGWIATSRAGHGSGSNRAETPRPATVTSPVRTDANRSWHALRALIPNGARCSAARGPGTEARCSVAGVDVDYRLLGGRSLRAAYLAPLAPGLSGGSMVLGPGSGPPVCAHGGEEERSWSRPTAPRRAVGRYACRIEQGRAAMWWTVDDRGLLAHAMSPGADLTSLFAWWESHSER
jgi:hypothetical protein